MEKNVDSFNYNDKVKSNYANPIFHIFNSNLNFRFFTKRSLGGSQKSINVLPEKWSFMNEIKRQLLAWEVLEKLELHSSEKVSHLQVYQERNILYDCISLLFTWIFSSSIPFTRSIEKLFPIIIGKIHSTDKMLRKRIFHSYSLLYLIIVVESNSGRSLEKYR